MSWSVTHIGSNKNRLTAEMRRDLTVGNQRGSNSVASAIETLVSAFGDINGYSLEIKTEGDIAVDGKGNLFIAIHTIDPGVIVQ